MEIKFFPQERFRELDFSKLERNEHATNGTNYSFGKGGSGYIYGSGWFISFYDESGEKEVWQLPEILSDFIDWSVKNGAAEKIREIKRVLTI